MQNFPYVSPVKYRLWLGCSPSLGARPVWMLEDPAANRQAKAEDWPRDGFWIQLEVATLWSGTR